MEEWHWHHLELSTDTEICSFSFVGFFRHFSAPRSFSVDQLAQELRLAILPGWCSEVRSLRRVDIPQRKRWKSFWTSHGPREVKNPLRLKFNFLFFFPKEPSWPCCADWVENPPLFNSNIRTCVSVPDGAGAVRRPDRRILPVFLTVRNGVRDALISIYIYNVLLHRVFRV